MDHGLASSMVYGAGANNTANHHYAGIMKGNSSKKPGKKGKRRKKSCKTP